MARRRGWKRGDHLVKDEESGFTLYGSEVGRDYYGVLKKKSEMDRMHPQEFVRAKADPYVVSPISPPLREFDTSTYNLGDFVGVTTVTAPIGPATHIYQPGRVGGGDPGIGEMAVGSTFEVR